MEATINIKGKDVKITLTADQETEVNKLTGKITDRIKTFEDAVQIFPPYENMKLLLNYSGSDKDLIAAQAFAKLTIIAKALNKGWVPDWNNSNQYKWYSWFKYSGSGFRFFVTHYAFTFTH